MSVGVGEDLLLGENPGGGRKVVPCVRNVLSWLISRNHGSGFVSGSYHKPGMTWVSGCHSGRGDAQQPLVVGGICQLAVSSKPGTGLWVLVGCGDPNAPVPPLMQPMGGILAISWALPKLWPDGAEAPRTTSGFDKNQEQFVWDWCHINKFLWP